jgi:Ca2+-binding EF-hand superfamily protein
LRRDFTLMAAYHQFSRSMQAKITIEEFMFGLDRLDIIMNPQNVELFYRRYDSDQDGRLGFWEFSNSLLPIDFRYREEVE